MFSSILDTDEKKTVCTLLLDVFCCVTSEGLLHKLISQVNLFLRWFISNNQPKIQKLDVVSLLNDVVVVFKLMKVLEIIWIFPPYSNLGFYTSERLQPIFAHLLTMMMSVITPKVVYIFYILYMFISSFNSDLFMSKYM